MSRRALSLLVPLLLVLAGCDPGTTTFVTLGGDDAVAGDLTGEAAGGDAALADGSAADAGGDGDAGADGEVGAEVALDSGPDAASDIAADGVGDAPDAASDTVPDGAADGAGDAMPDAATDVPLEITPDVVQGVCEAVTCSGEGVCDSSSGSAVCDCGSGYETGADPKTCVPAACVPSCTGKICGSDGCGGSCGECPCPGKPNPVIVVAEGEEVIPLTTLHLSGEQSVAAAGGINAYTWKVQQPSGSTSKLLPNANVPDPKFVANVAGVYVFSLSVIDSQGVSSCVSAQVIVHVVPDSAIYVELLWNTDGDEDQTDEGPEAGADLDLHFAHPFATGEDVDGDGKLDGWFDQPFDCFWFNAHPNWGSLDKLVDDNPGLDRDDTDGAGPEIMNLNLPEEGLTYKIGAHYWSGHNFGPSQATVRVYIYGSLTFEAANVQLVNLDMWEAATVAWPSGNVTPITNPGGAYRITHNYKSPFFPSP